MLFSAVEVGERVGQAAKDCSIGGLALGRMDRRRLVLNRSTMNKYRDILQSLNISEYLSAHYQMAVLAFLFHACDRHYQP